MNKQRWKTGRLLLFEPDPVKRHYFQKYVLGVIWRRLSEAERQERIAAIVRERRQATAPSAAPRRTERGEELL